MPVFLSAAALKAYAALIAPLVVALAAWLADNAGIDIPVDIGRVEAVVLAVGGWLTVYFTRNQPAES